MNLEDMKTPTELHPALKPYVDKTKYFPVLKHPLVFMIPYTPAMNYICNEQYKFKTERIEKAKNNKEWSTYIFMHERPYRWDAFFKIMNDLEDEDYWETLGSIWSYTENLWQVQNMLPIILNADRGSRGKIMDEKEHKFLESLPDEVVIYRGHQALNRKGYSWSLSYWRACWFAQRFQTKKQGVVQGIANKKDIIGVFLGRNEYEIAIDPSKVNIKSIKKLNRPDWMKTLYDNTKNKFALKQSVHGPWHWDKVERNAICLSKLTKDADLLVCRLFAILHDAERLDDGEDKDHGRRAADYITKNLITTLREIIDNSQLNKLLIACSEHNDGKTTIDPTIGVCWDADRLDLSRVGIIPSPELLSTEAAKNLVWRI